MSCLIDRNSEGKISGVYLNGVVNPAYNEITGVMYEVLNRLKETGLAKDVRLMDDQSILSTFGEDFVNTKGFVKDGVVYINEGKATLDTPIHEFGHKRIVTGKLHTLHL